MSRGFVSGDRKQLLLLSPSVDKWVPKNHVVRFIHDIVKQMTLTSFYKAYGIEGRPPYDPAMMLSVLIYAYCQGRRSSRKISKACEEELPYRWLTGNTVPDHCAISRFRSRHEKLMRTVFCEILSLCAEAGLVRVGDVYLDGTKIKGNASLSANRTLSQLDEEIEQMLEEAKAADEEEDRRLGPRRADELPEELEDPGSRLARLKEAKARLEAKATAEREEQEKKIRDREEEEKASGRKKPGPKPKDPDDVVRQDRKANATDPASRIMKTRQGHVQGYNGQAVVSKEQIILGAEVTQEENDLHQLEPMIQETKESLKESGIDKSIDTCTADTGYWRDDLPVKSIEADGPELFIAIKKDCEQRKQCREDGNSSQERMPANANSRDRMARRLRTKRGKAKYRLRSQSVEPVFGQIKAAMGIFGFLRRGLSAVRSEWKLICACHNLMKLFRAYGVVTTE